MFWKALKVQSEWWIDPESPKQNFYRQKFQLIDRQNTNSELRDLEFEVEEERKRNADLAATVEELFKEHHEKEDVAHDLEAKVEETRRENENLVNNMVKTDF